MRIKKVSKQSGCSGFKLNLFEIGLDRLSRDFWALAEVCALLHHLYSSGSLFCCERADGRLQLWPPHMKTPRIPPPADR